MQDWNLTDWKMTDLGIGAPLQLCLLNNRCCTNIMESYQCSLPRKTLTRVSHPNILTFLSHLEIAKTDTDSMASTFVVQRKSTTWRNFYIVDTFLVLLSTTWV